MSEDDEWTDDGRAGDLTTDSDSYFGGGNGDLTTDSDADDLFTESDSDEEGGGRSKRCATLDTSRYLVVRKVGVGTTATALLCLDLVEANRPVILKNTQKSRFRSLPNPSSTELSRHPLGYLGEIAVLKKLSNPPTSSVCSTSWITPTRRPCPWSWSTPPAGTCARRSPRATSTPRR